MDDLDDWFWDVLKAESSVDRGILSLDQVCDAVKDLNSDPCGHPDHWSHVQLWWEPGVRLLLLLDEVSL